LEGFLREFEAALLNVLIYEQEYEAHEDVVGSELVEKNFSFALPKQCLF